MFNFIWRQKVLESNHLKYFDQHVVSTFDSFEMRNKGLVINIIFVALTSRRVQWTGVCRVCLGVGYIEAPPGGVPGDGGGARGGEHQGVEVRNPGEGVSRAVRLRQHDGVLPGGQELRGEWLLLSIPFNCYAERLVHNANCCKIQE